MSAAPEGIWIPRRYRVGAVRPEIDDTVSLELAPDGGEAPAFEPGQFNMLYAFGIGEAAISLSGDPADRARLVHTVRGVGPVSRALAGLAVGASVGVRGPFGAGWPMVNARGRDLVLIAGGLGLAPLWPALLRVLADRSRFGRVVLLAGMRTPREILFRAPLAAWQGRADLEVEVTVDRADTDWHGHVGVVTNLIPRLELDPRKATAFVCGPEIMMRHTAERLLAAGLESTQIFVSMERNMKCAIGLCGHCQFGSAFVCKDGPVMRFDRVAHALAVREL